MVITSVIDSEIKVRVIADCIKLADDEMVMRIVTI